MAGHSKWANIKHRKGAQDKKRAKIFTRVLKEIHIAVKEGNGDDPEVNPKLRLAINNAKGANVPKDTIARAIKKAAGADAESYEEVNFEGYLPQGVAVFIEASTDNNQRTVANVRSIFNKTGGSLGTKGSLEFIFDRKGVFTLGQESLAQHDLEELELELIGGGAEEIDKGEIMWIVTTNFEDFGNMQNALEDLKIEAQNAELQRIPNSTVRLEVEDARKILSTIDRFEDDEDVQNVFHNLEMTEELETALSEE
ncbi:MAG: YebC/PmpR family DNA-binding transcriptional regulator [Owenweeksia sp.]|nr:YebC/PmpR family DNA-binding transcriptional regulator [Owenweeksia sp.]